MGGFGVLEFSEVMNCQAIRSRKYFLAGASLLAKIPKAPCTFIVDT